MTRDLEAEIAKARDEIESAWGWLRHWREVSCDAEGDAAIEAEANADAELRRMNAAEARLDALLAERAR